MRLGSLTPPTDAQETQRPTAGPSEFLSPRPQSITRRVPGGSPCPAWEGGAAPMQCAARISRARRADLGKLDQTERSGDRVVDVESAQ